RRKLAEASEEVGRRVAELRAGLEQQRQALASAAPGAADDAAQLAAGKVRQVLKGLAIDEPGRFDRAAANRELQTMLHAVVERVVRPLAGHAFQALDESVRSFAAESSLCLDVSHKVRRHTWTSTARPAAVGRAAGGASGML